MGAISVLLIAGGAVLAFAVRETTFGSVDVWVLGVILMVVGAIGLVAALLQGAMFGFSRTTQRRVMDDGTVIERERTSRL